MIKGFRTMLRSIDANIDLHVKQGNVDVLHRFFRQLGFDSSKDRDILIDQLLNQELRVVSQPGFGDSRLRHHFHFVPHGS